MSASVGCSVLSEYVIPDRIKEGTSVLEGEKPEVGLCGLVEKAINRAKSEFLRGQDRIGKESEEFITSKQIEINKKTARLSWRVCILLDTFKKSGLALDIGCGTGVNSIKLLLSGWNVYLVEKEKVMLDQFDTYLLGAKALASDQKTSLGKHRIIHKDITTMSLKSCYLDLVLADSVLQYIHPDLLIPTIRKIYKALLPGGIFMGSFLSNRELKTDEDILLMAQACSLHAYSYTNPKVVPSILRYAGFFVEACSFFSLQDHLSHPVRVVSFVARKSIKS